MEPPFYDVILFVSLGIFKLDINAFYVTLGIMILSDAVAPLPPFFYHFIFLFYFLQVFLIFIFSDFRFFTCMNKWYSFDIPMSYFIVISLPSIKLLLVLQSVH